MCGDITHTGHTSWGCRFFAWLDNQISRLQDCKTKSL